MKNTKCNTYFTMESVIIISSTNWLNSPLTALKEEKKSVEQTERNAREAKRLEEN